MSLGTPFYRNDNITRHVNRDSKDHLFHFVQKPKYNKDKRLLFVWSSRCLCNNGPWNKIRSLKVHSLRFISRSYPLSVYVISNSSRRHQLEVKNNHSGPFYLLNGQWSEPPLLCPNLGQTEPWSDPEPRGNKPFVSTSLYTIISTIPVHGMERGSVIPVSDTGLRTLNLNYFSLIHFLLKKSSSKRKMVLRPAPTWRHSPTTV